MHRQTFGPCSLTYDPFCETGLESGESGLSVTACHCLQQTDLVPSLDHAETAQARSIEPTGHAMGKPSDAKSSTPTAQLLVRASLC